MAISKRSAATVAVLGVVGLAVVIFCVRLKVRDQHIEALYTDLIGHLYGSTEQMNLVAAISDSKSPKATEKLVMIASGGPNSSLPGLFAETSAMAVRKLHGRGGDQVTIEIAQLLQPQTSLMVRVAAAEELRTRTCSSACAAEVLHYLERLFNGEVTIDERLGSDVDGYLAADRGRLADALNDILKKNDSATLEVLENVYGLGSIVPSQFAIKAAAGIPLPESCPLLIASKRNAQLWKIADSPSVTEAIDALHCH